MASPQHFDAPEWSTEIGRPVRFEPASDSSGATLTKLGGHPVWLTSPQWPLSRSSGEPMTFIGQFRLDTKGEVRMAYLFMTECDEYVHGTWEPEAGENAVIVQPDGQLPHFVTARAQHEGPSWPVQDHLPVADPVDEDALPCEFLSGEPVWMQGDETPGPGWKLVAQFTDRLGYNFGDGGVGYLFVSPSRDEGRFLWQCG